MLNGHQSHLENSSFIMPAFKAIVSCCKSSNNVYICFYFHYSGKWVIEDLVVICVIQCSPYVISKSFIVSDLTFKFLIHFE